MRQKPGAIGKYDMWPRYQGMFVRRPVEHDAGDDAVPEREAVIGRWGLISAMTQTDGLHKAGKLSTFDARSETAPPTAFLCPTAQASPATPPHGSSRGQPALANHDPPACPWNYHTSVI